MKSISRASGLLLMFASVGASAAFAQATNPAIDGRWDASLNNHGTIIPFRLDISGSGASLKGTFYNGFVPFDGTTNATFQDGKLVLNIEHYLTTITATLKDGQFTGNINTQSRGPAAEYDFQATRHVDTVSSAANVPSIAGSWIIPLDAPTSKGEKAFRFIVEQRGAEVAASILRVDGDTGAYSGTYKDGRWVLSHFDGSRPGVIEVSLTKDGTLEVLQNAARAKKPAEQATAGAGAYQTVSASSNNKSYGEETVDSRYTSKLVAFRADVALAKGLPQPENYDTHTTVRDPKEKFAFNFPDVNGKLVSSDDPRFKDKVVLAIVTGTWCPNCHDEAQYLVQLDKKYRDKGLAIVALDFEEPEQQGSLERERAFVKQYGVEYTYLIAGAPAEMWEKVPQAVNLNTWPATIFVGRDGLVKGIHSGFASPASGEFNQQLQKDFTAKIEQLLAEKASQHVASSLDGSNKPGE
ncbi:TlpA family protein disulfide reductase [Granulicella pectinivorans]|nr:TlpA disulfide reductase family protein [Granulicella pectinivorans]